MSNAREGRGRIRAKRYRCLSSHRGYQVLFIFGLVASLLAPGCEQKMDEQPRYEPHEPSTFFDDGTSARPLVPGTVARGQLREDDHFYRGRSGGDHADTFPMPVTRGLLERGRERFNIFCSVCHGWLGDGDGMVVRRGFTRPPSFHSEYLRRAPPGHFFSVITDGFGAMPSYADQIPPRDRWAIIAYIRALQLSQHATVDDVPPEKLKELRSGG